MGQGHLLPSTYFSGKWHTYWKNIAQDNMLRLGLKETQGTNYLGASCRGRVDRVPIVIMSIYGSNCLGASFWGRVVRGPVLRGQIDTLWINCHFNVGVYDQDSYLM